MALRVEHVATLESHTLFLYQILIKLWVNLGTEKQETVITIISGSKRIIYFPFVLDLLLYYDAKVSAACKQLCFKVHQRSTHGSK